MIQPTEKQIEAIRAYHQNGMPRGDQNKLMKELEIPTRPQFYMLFHKVMKILTK